MPSCPVTYEAVAEHEDYGDTGCPACGQPAEAHKTEQRKWSSRDELRSAFAPSDNDDLGTEVVD